MKKTFVAVLCMVFLLYATVVFAEVSGQVTDTALQVVPNARVVFTNEADPDVVSESTTDANGYYVLDIVTGVAEENSPAANPYSFSLRQNYPNPFNPTTIIPFSIERSGQVELTICNVLGQQVRTLVKSQLSSGTYYVSWDGCDDAGRGVSAGVYLYRLASNGLVESRKMLLLDGGGVSASSAGVVTLSEPVRHGAAKPTEGASYTVTITGETIEPYELPGVIVTGSETINFIAVNRDVVIVVARMVAKEDQIETVKSELLSLLQETREEEGNLRYDLIQVGETPSVFLFYEEWRNEDAITAHMETQHFQDFYAQIEDLFVAENGLRVTRYKEISPPRVDNIIDPDLITVITRLECKEGKAEEVKEIMIPFLHKTRGESGCLGYDLHRSTEDTSVFMLFENWDGQDAVNFHLSTQFFQDFYAQFDELFNVVEVNISAMLSEPVAKISTDNS